MTSHPPGAGLGVGERKWGREPGYRERGVGQDSPVNKRETVGEGSFTNHQGAPHQVN